VKDKKKLKPEQSVEEIPRTFSKPVPITLEQKKTPALAKSNSLETEFFTPTESEWKFPTKSPDDFIPPPLNATNSIQKFKFY
jgi:hypothetical protein